MASLPTAVKHGLSAHHDLIASDTAAKRSAITSSVAGKVPSIASIPQLPSAEVELDRLEPHSLTLQQMPPQSAISINGALAVARDDGQNIDDNRSSSLSDVGEAADDNEPYAELRNSNRVSDGTDSEAETERLEQSPQKIRKNLRVFLKQDEPRVVEDSINPDTEISMPDIQESVGVEVEVGPQCVRESDSPKPITTSVGEAATTPKTTSLGDLSDNVIRVFSPLEIAGTKRKRTPSRSGSPRCDDKLEAFPRKRAATIKNKADLDHNLVVSDHADAQLKQQSVLNATNVSPVPSPWPEAGETAVEGVEYNPSEVGPPEDDSSRTKRYVKGKKGRRKGKKLRTDESGEVESVDPIDDETAQVEHNPMISAAENGEAAEDIGDAEGEEEAAEAALRSEEELAKKNLALDALTAIEKQFATFKDKLYDERLAQLNNELELLSQPNPTHPEYLAMMRCIDARLQEKISHEQTLLSYKIRALEVKCVAERSQLHSQYFQEVRDIREKKLEEAGEQWYQIQRDRRSWDGSVPDLMYKFPTRRSQQITQQSAYNMEVSILSGVAKYVGFPAAPSIEGARTAEIEHDLKIIGIKPSLRTALQHHLPPVSTAIRRVSHTNSRPAAEEQFLEQTPWANPQHPAHHHLQQVQGQLPRQPRVNSPSSTSSVQRRLLNQDPRDEVSTATTTASTAVPVSSNIQSTVCSNRIQPRDGTIFDPKGRSSSATNVNVSELGVNGPSPRDQQALLPSSPDTYATAQMHTKVSSRLSTGSLGTLHQGQPAAISLTLSSTTGKSPTSNPHDFTSRAGAFGSTSALGNAPPKVAVYAKEEQGASNRAALGQFQPVTNDFIPI
ncbi:MAG: hypothetical protein M1835_001727 [Candelina submexicana]|nr:MAG: hypothetical protein M1835_001727 [Candelina submexicana]